MAVNVTLVTEQLKIPDAVRLGLAIIELLNTANVALSVQPLLVLVTVTV
jgi:hypothetical protein